MSDTIKKFGRRVRTRGAFDFALASLAVGMSFIKGRVDAPRIVLGAAALKPWRAADAEKVLAGTRQEPKTIAAAAAAAVRGAAPLEKNDYKIPMFKGLAQEVLEGVRQPPDAVLRHDRVPHNRATIGA